MLIRLWRVLLVVLIFRGVWVLEEIQQDLKSVLDQRTRIDSTKIYTSASSHPYPYRRVWGPRWDVSVDSRPWVIQMMVEEGAKK